MALYRQERVPDGAGNNPDGKLMCLKNTDMAVIEIKYDENGAIPETTYYDADMEIVRVSPEDSSDVR